MLVQTHSYLLKPELREEHARLTARMAAVLARLGCVAFEVLEQVDDVGQPTGRVVQILRFRNSRHHREVQSAEAADAEAQQLVRRFAHLIDHAGQLAAGTFQMRYYHGDGHAV